MQDIDIRLMVLYALNKAGIALEEDRLCGLIATAAPVSYFFVMQQLPSIAESGNIVRYEEDGKRYAALTPVGERTLGFFEHRVHPVVRSGIDTYAADLQKKADPAPTSIDARYEAVEDGGYRVYLRMTEKGETVFALEFVVGTAKEAAAMCRRFESDCGAVYTSLFGLLYESGPMEAI